MSPVTIAITTLLAALLVFTAIRKLSHRESVVRSYLRVGVREERLNLLAAILLGAAAGLLAGLVWPPVGLAAGVGLVGYFAVAVASHVRAGDLEHVATSVVYWLLAAGVAVLHLLALV
jgi:hypothetical protein